MYGHRSDNIKSPMSENISDITNEIPTSSSILIMIEAEIIFDYFLREDTVKISIHKYN